MGKPVINRERLAQTFVDLVQIDSVSKEEGEICRDLQSRLADLGATVVVDDAGNRIGAETGNLIANLQGNRACEPLLISAHMDTVEPGRGIEPQLKDGIFSSRGNTILGADDKCAIAVILEAVQTIQEQDLACGPLEVVFSICEEMGLQGAKHLAFDRIFSRMGFVLDTHNTEAIITHAPAANRLVLQIHGKAAHAGAVPEKGISAISLASKAIAQLDLGRIDHETTCNIGLIQGGIATNIVPDQVKVQGEARSHDVQKLKMVTDTIVGAFQKVVDDYPVGIDDGGPQLIADVELDFDLLSIADDHKVVALAKQAAANLNRPMGTAVTGGGSDANVFSQHGIVTGVLGVGFDNVHTVDESVPFEDMVRTTELLIEIIRLHANGKP